MILLGIDTATASTTVGLRLTDGTTLSARDDPAPGEHPGHATRLLRMADELLARADLAWSDLERIAVGLGPGRFTGLRVGIATARGLAQSLSAELVGVSSLRALAVGAAPQSGGAVVLAVIDARRGQAFAGAFSVTGEGSVAEQLGPACVASPEDLAGTLTRAEQVSGEPIARWLAVGDGAIRFREALEAAGVTVPEDQSVLHLLDAHAVCELGIGVPAAANYEEIVPDYRRRPDAEIALQGAAAGGR
jgi:tRNA threonylcarbamoyladenosine biosynthesis protein TsaB